MNKICGYNCEHNKGGTCELTSCDKQIYLNTSTTIEPEVLTRWQDPTIDEYKKEIERLNKECDTYMKIATKKDNIINKAIELIKEAGTYDEELKTFCDDIWEELPTLLNILQGEDKE